MALGLHGQHGAVVARPVVEEQQPDGVPVWGIRAWERAKTTKIVKQGNAQVDEIIQTFTDVQGPPPPY